MEQLILAGRIDLTVINNKTPKSLTKIKEQQSYNQKKKRKKVTEILPVN